MTPHFLIYNDCLLADDLPYRGMQIVFNGFSESEQLPNHGGTDILDPNRSWKNDKGITMFAEYGSHVDFLFGIVSIALEYDDPIFLHEFIKGFPFRKGLQLVPSKQKVHSASGFLSCSVSMVTRLLPLRILYPYSSGSTDSRLSCEHMAESMARRSPSEYIASGVSVLLIFRLT